MRLNRAIFAMAFLSLTAACSVPGPGGAPDGIHDPHEAGNRQVHEFNRRLDQALFASRPEREPGAGPSPVRQTVSNFADTVSQPQNMVNYVLQGRPDAATRSLVRFAVNATLGFGGLADVASDLGIREDDTDFGETLFVWGVPEGAYQELPVLGPSTERRTAGHVADLFTDPLSYVIPAPERYLGTAAKIADKAGDRAAYSGTVESVLYDSADSYSQLRLIWLQNRRFELGDTSAQEADDIDPYALDTEGF